MTKELLSISAVALALILQYLFYSGLKTRYRDKGKTYKIKKRGWSTIEQNRGWKNKNKQTQRLQEA